MSNSPSGKEKGFEGLGIAPKLLSALQALGFKEPTPIQRQAIPVATSGKDVIGIAQTGTGKTLAFGIPMIQRLGKEKGKGLVLLPTRELAQQVEEEFQKIGKTVGLRTAVVIGGESESRQFRQLAKKPHVIVATPGRLVDFIERGKVMLSDVTVLALDEADRMFDMGFAPQLKKILLAIPRQRQTMLFSATMPRSIVNLAKEHMGLPVRIEVAPQGTAAELVDHELFIVPRSQKIALLAQVLAEHKGSFIVFTRTKYGAKAVTRRIVRMDHTAVEIHGNRSQPQRKAALEGFKKGRYRVLVATDIAARGIDVEDVEVVLNFDLPMTAEDYVHRIGRTGRAGKAGKAIAFATPEQARDVRAIERLIRKQLPIRPLPKDLPPPPAEERYVRDDRPQRGRGDPRSGSPRRPSRGAPTPYRSGRSARPSRGSGPSRRR
jgi:ATP-dependent RNA helicase RhlE